jgi:hypothetical protein
VTERWLELVLLYVVAPCAFAWMVRRVNYRGAMFPLLWVLTSACLVIALRDPAFDRALLYRFPLLHPHVRVAVLRFCVLTAALAIVSRISSPAWFLWLPRKQPRLWWLLLVGYPGASALPQGIIWRVFFVHRYAQLFDRGALLAAGGIAFGIAHVTFRNPVAIALTATGGAIFLDTYLATQSLLLATLEHGAYGIAVFTFGLGRYVYLASRP